MPMHRLVAGLVAAAALASAPGCQLAKPTGPGGGSTAALKGGGKANPAALASKTPTGTGTRVVGKDGAILGKIRLTGQVKLLVAGIVSDHQGGVISNQGGALISNNGGALVSNNGGGLVSNNGGGILGKIRYALNQAAAAERELRLADAAITVHDAAGRQLLGPDGAPITATTDKEGAFTLSADLPAEALVLRVKLWQGGELATLVARDKATERVVPIDTATSLGAAYVLDKFVKGDQATFDKLPASEANALRAVLGGAQGLMEAAPKYDAAELVALTDKLRAQAPTVDQKLEDIKAILIGQPRLGAGRLATEVALATMGAIAVGRDGTLLIGEKSSGRIKAVGADGRIATLADAQFGQVKRNFIELFGLAEGPDGTRYVGARGVIWRLGADGEPTRVVGTGKDFRGAAVGVPAESAGLAMTDFDVGPDGTIWIAEFGEGARLLHVGANGLVEQAELAPVAGLNAVHVGPDGSVYVLGIETTLGNSGVLWRRTPDGKVTRMAEGLAIGLYADDLTLMPDGTVYVAEMGAGRVVGVAPDGTRSVLTGPGAPADAPPVTMPGALAAAADGTLYVGDRASGVVHVRRGGRWATAAGLRGGALSDPQAGIAVNTPSGAFFDEQGRLLIAESDANQLRRLEGGLLRTIAGTTEGFGGDGGPADRARMSHPVGLAGHAGALYFVDHGNGRMRRVAADGTIATIAGGGLRRPLGDEAVIDADQLDVGRTAGLAVGPDGSVYFTLSGALLRRDPAGVVTRLAGKATKEGTGLTGSLSALDRLSGPVKSPIPLAGAPLVAPLGLAMGPKGELYIADAGRFEVLRVDDPAGPSPTIRTFAGLGVVAGVALLEDRAAADRAAKGDGIPALEASVITPISVACAADGTVYVGEFGTTRWALAVQAYGLDLPIDPSTYPVHPRVRRIGPDGTIHTVAGEGGRYASDPLAEDGLLILGAMAVAPDGRLAIADSGTNLVRILPAAGLLP